MAQPISPVKFSKPVWSIKPAAMRTTGATVVGSPIPIRPVAEQAPIIVAVPPVMVYGNVGTSAPAASGLAPSTASVAAIPKISTGAPVPLPRQNCCIPPASAVLTADQVPTIAKLCGANPPPVIVPGTVTPLPPKGTGIPQSLNAPVGTPNYIKYGAILVAIVLLWALAGASIRSYL
jgi:hypothetical protein